MEGDEYDKQDLSDLKLAYDLLAGIVETDKKGLPRQRYLNKNQEETARQALGRLLRNRKPLDGLVRIWLAGHFDGVTLEYQTSPGPVRRGFVVQRRLEFVNPGRQPLQDRRRLLLAWKVAERLYKDSNESIEKAVAEVAEEYEFSDDKSVWNAWAEFKEGLLLRKTVPLELPKENS